MITLMENSVEISKAGDVNETRIWTVLKNVLPLKEARCATVYQGYVVFRHVVNYNGWLLGTLITYRTGSGWTTEVQRAALQ